MKLDGSVDGRQQLAALQHNKQGEGLQVSGGGQRIMVGTPASALRGTSGSRPATPKSLASPSPNVMRSHQSPMLQADTSKLQKVRQEAGGEAVMEDLLEHLGDNAGGGMSGPGAGRWRGKREPPPSWMMKQRQLSALQGGDARPPVKFASSEAARTVGAVRMAGKQQLLHSAQQRLYSILQQQPPEPPNHTPLPRDVSAKMQHQELVFPVAIQEGYDNPGPPGRACREQPSAAKAEAYDDAQGPTRKGQPNAAEGFASRLRALDGVVMEQRLSLAETEKNVLRRERAELQAQLRRQALEQRQAQEKMQEDLQGQLANLCKTFDKVGNAMLGMNAPRGGGTQEPGAGPVAATDRRMLDQMERELEERIAKELMCFCKENHGPKLKNRKQQFACVVGTGGPSSSALDLQVGVSLAEKVDQPGRPGVGGKQVGEAVWSYGRLVVPRDLHSADSPALAALLSGGIYSPVCSWVHDESAGTGGTVGELSKLDPLRGDDWVDDFLLEAIIAIGVREAFQYPTSFMPTWLSLHRQDEDRISSFPVSKLSSLSQKPSISTNAMALKLLTGAGIPVSPQLARISIREAVATLSSEPGVWLGGQKEGKLLSKEEGLSHAAECISSLAMARSLLPKAREAQELSRAAAEAAKALDDEMLEEEEEDSSFLHDDDADDEVSAVRKKEIMERRQAKQMKRQQVLFEKKIKEDEIHLRSNAHATEALQAWTGALRRLPRPANEAQEIAKAEMPRQGIYLSETPIVQEVVVKKAATGRHPWEEMRERKDRELLLDSFYAWAETSAAALLESRNYLKKVLNLFRAGCKQSKKNRDKCLFSYVQKQMSYQRIPTLSWAWERWNEQEDLGSLGHEQHAHQQHAPDLEETLHMLQQAVVETHSKHSRLLEMTHKEEQLQELMDRLPPAVSKALTQAGITSVPELVNIHKVKGGDGLRNLGIEEVAHREMLSVLLKDAEGEEFTGPKAGDKPDPNSIAGARDKMASEMEALRLKLQIKQQKLAESVENMKKDGKAEEPEMSEQEKSLSVINQVLEGLGGKALQPSHQMSVKNKWGGGEGKADDVADESGEGKTAKDSSHGSDAAPGADEDETDGDRETKKYMDHLKAEGDVHQAVLKLLSEKLGEEAKKEEEKSDEGAKDERKNLVIKQKEMEDSLKHAINVINKARSLLDQPDGNAGIDQFPDDKRGHSRENDLCTCSFKADGTLKVANDFCPVNRTPAEGLHEKHTSAEEEAIRLAEEAKRRLEHSDALELENSRLKKQIAEPRPSRAVEQDESEVRGNAEEEVHWTSLLSDPELAAKYGGESGGWNDKYGGESGGWDDNVGTALDAAAATHAGGKLSWKLTSVEGGLPVSRSDVLDSEIKKRVDKARQNIFGQIDSCKAKIKDLEVDRDQRLKDLQAGKMPKISEEEHDRAVLAIIGNLEQIKLLEDQLDGLDWERELKEMETNGKRLEEEARVSLEEAKQAHATDPTSSSEAEVKDCEARVVRVKASTQIKIRQREKEVEMAVLAIKMKEDETRLHEEQKALQEKMAQVQLEEQEQLAQKLRSMSDTIDTTIRGRCRSDVLANLSGVNKLKSAISKHRLAVDGVKEQERKKLAEERQKEDEKKVTEEKNKENEILAKAERKTEDMVHRERLLKEAEEALAEKKQKLFREANVALDKTDKAVQAGESSDTLCRSHPLVEGIQNCIPTPPPLSAQNLTCVVAGVAEATELHNMWVRTPIVNQEEPDYHALGMLAAAQAIVKDLTGAVGSDDTEDFQKLEERFKALQETVSGAEKKLKEEAEQSLKDLEVILRKDTKNMSPELAGDIAKVRVSCESSLAKLKAVGAKGRELSALETRLKSTWEVENIPLFHFPFVSHS